MLTLVSLVLIALAAFTVLPILILKWMSKSPKRLHLSGKHVLITGGSQGIGLELAKKSSAKGADVTILARNVAQMNIAKVEIGKWRKYPDSQRVHIVSCDLSAGYAAVERAIQDAEKQLGDIDVLINCAGFAKCKYFGDIEITEFKALMDVNYFGSVYTSKYVVEKMKKRSFGAIVFVSSQGGQVGFVGMSAYSPTKYAVKGLAECLYSELLPYNINVSVAYPPDTDTPGFATESQDKVIECQEISETGGLAKPDYVANEIINGIENGTFSIDIGIDGLMIDTVSSGLAPYPGFIRSFIQVYLIGVFKLIALYYAAVFQGIVAKHHGKRVAKQT